MCNQRTQLCAFSLGLSLVAFVIGGCQNEEPSSPPGKQEEPKTEQTPATAKYSLTQIETAELAPLGDYMPPVDDFHLEVPVPEGWLAAPRSSQYLMHLRGDRASAYPAILVTGAAAEGDLQAYTAANIEAAYDKLREELKEHDSTIEQPLRAIKLGDRYALEHVRRASAENRPIERLMIVVVEDGRKYDFELRAIEGTLEQFRDHAYAVIAETKIK